MDQLIELLLGVRVVDMIGSAEDGEMVVASEPLYIGVASFDPTVEG